MQTIKTAIVVVLLLVVLYGAYDVLTRPEPTPPPEVAALLDDAESIDVPDISVESPVVVTPDASQATSPASGLAPAASSAASSGTALAAQPPVAAPVSATAPAASGSTAPATPTTPVAPAGTQLKQNPFYNEKPADMPTATPAAASREDDGHAHGQEAHADQPADKGSSSAPADTPPSPTGSPSDSSERASGFSPPQVPAGDSSAEPATPTAAPPASSSSPQPTAGERAYQRVKLAAQADIESAKYAEALRKLSVFYRSPDLSPEEQRALLDLLDPLAARVIYSRESHLADPYETREHDTLFDIAKQFRVPWQLLQKINGVNDPQVLIPGTKLKVVPGPFRAEVYLADAELTLFLGDLYAGRFPVSVGGNPSPQPRVYHVKDKQTARAYYGADGRSIPAGSPLNPYGRVWIDLGNDVSIHGSPAQPSQRVAGCIGLSPQDADDVYSILSIGSEVKIRP